MNFKIIRQFILLVIFWFGVTSFSVKHPDSGFLIGKWKSTTHKNDSGTENIIFDKDSAFVHEITFNPDFTFIKLVNGVKSIGKYKLTRKKLELFACDKNLKCKAYYIHLFIIGSTQKRLIKNNCDCQLILPEEFHIKDKKGKESATYLNLCYVREK